MKVPHCSTWNIPRADVVPSLPIWSYRCDRLIRLMTRHIRSASCRVPEWRCPKPFHVEQPSDVRASRIHATGQLCAAREHHESSSRLPTQYLWLLVGHTS